VLRRVDSSGRRRSRSRARAPKRSLSLLLVALGLLLVQGPTLLHLLLVPHATCEHGELIERAAARPTPPEVRLPKRSAELRWPEAPSGEQQVERAHGDRDGHEHCEALAVRHTLPALPMAIASASLVWIAPIDATGEGCETRPVPLLALAPKSSPPV
jgi:hypothetical protein